MGLPAQLSSIRYGDSTLLSVFEEQLLVSEVGTPKIKIPTLAAKDAARMGHPIHLHFMQLPGFARPDSPFDSAQGRLGDAVPT